MQEKMIGFFAPDRDIQELLVPIVKAGLRGSGVEITTRVEERDHSLRGYTLIIAKHSDETELYAAQSYLAGMVALFNVLSYNDDAKDFDMDPEKLRKLVQGNIELASGF